MKEIWSTVPLGLYINAPTKTLLVILDLGAVDVHHAYAYISIYSIVSYV